MRRFMNRDLDAFLIPDFFFDIGPRCIGLVRDVYGFLDVFFKKVGVMRIK